MYRVKVGKTLHVPGCREVKSGQPVPENIVGVCKSLGNLSGLLSAGVLESFEPEFFSSTLESANEEPTIKRGPGRPKFSQITDGVAADNLIRESEAGE